jgi:hypothetical protein
MIFLERELQGSALHGRVEFKVAGQGGLVAAAARAQASPNLPFYVLRATIHNDTPFPQLPQYTHSHTRTHTRTHITVLLMEEPVRWAHCFCHPLKPRGPLLALSCARGYQAAKLL